MTQQIQAARDLLKPGESAIVVFTHGPQLLIGPDDSGSTGNWKIRPSWNINRVVIYVRQTRHSAILNIWLADFVKITDSPQLGRSVVHFKNAAEVGQTAVNWRDFAQTWANPVRFIKRG